MDPLRPIVESAVLCSLRRGIEAGERHASGMFIGLEQRRLRGKEGAEALMAGRAARRFFDREVLPMVRAEWARVLLRTIPRRSP